MNGHRLQEVPSGAFLGLAAALLPWVARYAVDKIPVCMTIAIEKEVLCQ